MSYKEVVVNGFRWRIGNEEKVKNLKDNWIPNVAGFRVLRPTRVLDLDIKVCNFIDLELGTWDMLVLRVNFDAHDVPHVNSIPLSSRLREDKLILHFEKDGDYSVKMVYRLLGD